MRSFHVHRGLTLRRAVSKLALLALVAPPTLGCCAVVVSGCGGAPRRILLEEVVVRCETREERAAWPTVPIVVAAEPIRTEAVGFWWPECEPGEPLPHHPPGFGAFVYDGRHVALHVSHDADYQPEPPLYHRSSYTSYRLESRWNEDVLSVRLPDERWLEVGRFDGERFVFVTSRGEHHYARVHGPPPHVPWEDLADDRAPFDYAPHRQALQAAVHRAIFEALEACVGTVDAAHGYVEVTVAPDGARVDEPVVAASDESLATCAVAALQDLTIAPYESLSPASYRVSFTLAH